MKTILRIILILLAASIVAGAFSLAVNNNSTAVSTADGQPPALASSNGQSMIRSERGERAGESAAGGLAGVLGTLLKLSGITILVLVLQKGYR